MNRSLALAALVVAALVSPRAAHADDAVRNTARKVFADHQSAVVRLGGVMRMQMMGAPMGGQDEEREIDLVATVIGPKGLVVTSYAALNPLADGLDAELGPGMSIRVVSSVEEVWIQLDDGNQLAAEVVLEDKDLDLAFIRPIDTEDAAIERLGVIDLGRGGGDVAVLDRVVVLGRLDESMGYAPTVHFADVSAVLTRPRKAYMTGSAPGTPVFAASGRLLGLSVNMPLDLDDANAMQILMGAMQFGGRSIVLPVADLTSAVEQAREAPAE